VYYKGEISGGTTDSIAPNVIVIENYPQKTNESSDEIIGSDTDLYNKDVTVTFMNPEYLSSVEDVSKGQLDTTEVRNNDGTDN